MSATKTSRLGRRPKPARERRTEWIGAAVTRDEKRQFRAKAKEAGKSETEYLRQKVFHDPAAPGIGPA